MIYRMRLWILFIDFARGTEFHFPHFGTRSKVYDTEKKCGDAWISGTGKPTSMLESLE